jgi:hypothetical protein
MSTTSIRGSGLGGTSQIRALSIANADIATSAGIALTKLANTVIRADGVTAFTGDQSMGNFKLTNLAAPVSANDAARKADVDALAAGLHLHAAARVATAATLTLTTDYTRTGTGATHILTATANGALSIDGVSTGWLDIDNDGKSADPQSSTPASRVHVKDASDTKDNGIYAVKDKGSGGTPWKLIRASDADGAPTNEVSGGDHIFIVEGTANANTAWTISSPTGVATVDTDNIVWTQFAAVTAYTASNGVTKVVNDFQLDINGLSASAIASTDALAFYNGSVNKKITFANFESTLALNNISGTLNVSKGGTGATTLTSNGVLYGNGTSAVQATAQGANNTLFKGTGGAPAFTSHIFQTDNASNSALYSDATSMFEIRNSTESGGMNVYSSPTTTNSVTSGTVSIFSGGASGTTADSGVVSVFSGNATGTSGNVNISTGTGATVGKVRILTANSLRAEFDSTGLNLSGGEAYKIGGTSVLDATTLGSGVVTSSLTTVGTIGTGVWQGTAVAAQYGGTGVNGASAANGTLLIGNGSGYTLTTLTQGSGITITNGSGSITIAATGALTTSNFVYGEVPSGTIDGSNTAFTLANTPTAGTVTLYLGGLRLKSGAGNDYTISGSSITMLTVPQSGDNFLADYQK